MDNDKFCDNNSDNDNNSSNTNTGSSGGFFPRQKGENSNLSSEGSDPITGASGKNRSIAERIKSLFGSNSRNWEETGHAKLVLQPDNI